MFSIAVCWTLGGTSSHLFPHVQSAHVQEFGSDRVVDHSTGALGAAACLLPSVPASVASAGSMPWNQEPPFKGSVMFRPATQPVAEPNACLQQVREAQMYWTRRCVIPADSHAALQQVRGSRTRGALVLALPRSRPSISSHTDRHWLGAPDRVDCHKRRLLQLRVSA